MSIALLGAHIDNLQLISPIGRISLLVLDTVSFDRPLSWPFPLHYAAALVRAEYDDELAAASQERRTPVPVRQCCYMRVRYSKLEKAFAAIAKDSRFWNHKSSAKSNMTASATYFRLLDNSSPSLLGSSATEKLPHDCPRPSFSFSTSRSS